MPDTLAAGLDDIAHEAAIAVSATATGVALLDKTDHMTVQGAWGLTGQYRRRLARRPGLVRGVGPTGRAVSLRRRMMVPDIQADPELAPWHEAATSAGFRSMLSTPLDFEGNALGRRNAYRSEPGPWAQADMELLGEFADHAATAIRTSRLIARQERQLARLSGLVLELREQTHEHANRIHGIGALLALGERTEARRFIAGLLSDQDAARDAAIGRIDLQSLAGVVLAEIQIAAREGIALAIGEDTALAELPPGLGEAEAVAIVGHLLHQSFEAVADADASRRRVTFAARGGRDGVVFETVDQGDRLPSSAGCPLADAVRAAGGRLARRRGAAGNTTVVRVGPSPAR